MMNDPEKSDVPIVATKPPNASGRLDEEQVERRGTTKGNTVQANTRRAQQRVSVSQGLERVRQAARNHLWPERRSDRRYPRWEPGAVVPLAGFCAGGAQQWASLPRRSLFTPHV